MKAEDLSISELKVVAYDLMAGLEKAQRDLQAINQLIAQRGAENENKRTVVEQDTREPGTEGTEQNAKNKKQGT